MNSFKNKLLKEINMLETELDNNRSSCNLDKFNASKNELEQIEKHETQGHILRSKIRRWRKKLKIFFKHRKN